MDYTTEQHSDLLKQITVKAGQRAVIAITDEYAKPIREAGKKACGERWQSMPARN